MAVKPYLQLLRIPNLFTAAADSLAGWLLIEGSFSAPQHWVWLVLASVACYAGGVVLNDVFDIQVDRVERPDRPLPSGRIAFGTARLLGAALLGLGVVFAVASGTRLGWPVGVALAGYILLYDMGLKRTRLGPWAMGTCRGLNVLLGMSGSEMLGGPLGWLVAGSYALFVVGLTWISRSEVTTGDWKNVAVGAVFQAGAFAGLITACVVARSFLGSHASAHAFPGLGVAGLIALGMLVGFRVDRALREPTPAMIQRAVRFGIFTLVWLHVAVLVASRGIVPAIAVALLWFPAMFIGRWIYST